MRSTNWETRSNDRKRRCRSVINPETFWAFLLFLYATGMLVGEAVALLRKDIKFSEDTITVRRSYPIEQE